MAEKIEAVAFMKGGSLTGKGTWQPEGFYKITITFDDHGMLSQTCVEKQS